MKKIKSFFEKKPKPEKLDFQSPLQLPNNPRDPVEVTAWGKGLTILDLMLAGARESIAAAEGKSYDLLSNQEKDDLDTCIETYRRYRGHQGRNLTELEYNIDEIESWADRSRVLPELRRDNLPNLLAALARRNKHGTLSRATQEYVGEMFRKYAILRG